VLAPAPTVLATAETNLTTGTVNRVAALATTGDLLVAAAGDAGLAAWSLSSLTSPFPSSSIEIGAVGSAWIAAERAVIALPAGGLRRYTESSGIMNPGPSFGAGSVWKIQDGDGAAVLASAGSTLQLWDSSAATPASISSAALVGAITGAAMSGPRKAAVLLADKTVWSVDFSQSPAIVARLSVAGAPSFIAASSSGVAIAEITPGGNTLVRYYPGGETSSVVEATFEGTSNAGIALSSNGTAAAATFKGIGLVDLAAGGSPRYIAGSNTAPIRDLEIEGANVLALESGRLQVRRLSDGALLSAWELTSDGELVQASGSRAIVAGANGFTVIDTARTPVAPVDRPLTQDVPRFFRSAERDGSLLWLVEKSRADLLALDGHGIPLTAESLTYDETIVAAAAARGNLYTLSASGKLAGRDTAGRLVAQLAINEGADQQMNGMHAVGGALWVSLTRGCGAGGCEKKTLVVDAASGLVVTATLPGGILDVVWSGDRAWALSDTPREVRIYDIAKPGAPSLLNSASAAGDPVSIARGAGFVWT
ncbi:MAG TPA: hypothetical protein VLV48_08935, partial [Thermoanaerobaculia bacterium]|nr:hypothetical protein [Thermoanaerobaculia bacterium]